MFMLQMVTTQPESGASGSVTPEESGKTLSKLWQLGNIIATGNGEFSFYYAVPWLLTFPYYTVSNYYNKFNVYS